MNECIIKFKDITQNTINKEFSIFLFKFADFKIRFFIDALSDLSDELIKNIDEKNIL